MNYQPYYQPYNGIYQQRQDYQQPVQQLQPIQPMQPKILQGRLIDNEASVASAEIPFDFSVSYFPLTDGSAILTKQLLQDGTSKIVKFVPATEEEKEQPRYLSESDLEEYKDTVNDTLDELKEEVKEIKKELKARKDK